MQAYELKRDANYSNPPGSTNKAKGHRKVAFCFIVVSWRTRTTVWGSAGACVASGDNAQRAASRCQTRGERQSRE
jgi:hypothetical protein